jgi:peptidoglycan-associated lipoprotein
MAHRVSLAGATVAVVLASPFAPHAAADTFATAEAPAAFAVSDAQAGLFHPGAMPAVGAYMGVGWLDFGVRLRAGMLSDGPAPTGHFMDPHSGGLVSTGLAVRILAGPRTAGAWLEGVVGAGVTGSETVPVVEGGIGWDLAVGSVDIGPSVRYMHIAARSSDRLGDAGLVLVGIDVRFGRRRHDHGNRAAPIATPPPPPPPAPVEQPPARDLDAITDKLPSCAIDTEGCLESPFVMIDDRIVLDDRVLFDTDHAHVKSRGRDVVAAIVKAWRQHPEWTAVTIEGHADVRGGDDYNQALSERRAEAVRAVMIRDGADAGRIDAIGFGRSRPRDAGTGDSAHSHNRRVEFVVHRGE